MDYKKIFLSKGLRASIVYSKKTNTLMLYDEYEKHKDDIFNISINGTIENLVEESED